MNSFSQVAVVLGFVAGVGAGCAKPKADPKVDKADPKVEQKKLELQRETLRRLDAGPAVAEPDESTHVAPPRHTPPTNLPHDTPPPPPPTNQAPPR